MIRETKDEISYLESIQTSLDIAMTEDDLAAIKEELSETGYVRRKTVRKKIKLKNEPKTDEEVEERINEYFSFCERSSIRPGIESLCLSLHIREQRFLSGIKALIAVHTGRN